MEMFITGAGSEEQFPARAREVARVPVVMKNPLFSFTF